MNLDSLDRLYDRVLEAIAATLMAGVTLIIVAGFVFRWVGYSLVWYDEIGSISLCWLTYYAGALAALRGAHIGFPGLVNALPPKLRVAATALASAITIFFFGLLAVTGIAVVRILKGDTLVVLAGGFAAGDRIGDSDHGHIVRHRRIDPPARPNARRVPRTAGRS